MRHELQERPLFQGFQVCRDGLGGVFQPQAVCPGCRTHRPRGEVKQMGQKLIGMLGFDAIWGQMFRGKMPQVIGDDDIRPAVNGGCQHVAVAGVGQVQRGDERLEAGHQAIARLGIHQLAGAFKPFAGQVWPVVQQMAHPFFINQMRPFGPVEIGQGQLHQQIPQRRGIEHTGIIQRGERRHA